MSTEAAGPNAFVRELCAMINWFCSEQGYAFELQRGVTNARRDRHGGLSYLALAELSDINPGFIRDLMSAIDTTYLPNWPTCLALLYHGMHLTDSMIEQVHTVHMKHRQHSRRVLYRTTEHHAVVKPPVRPSSRPSSSTAPLPKRPVLRF